MSTSLEDFNACPAPFYDRAKFGDGGFVKGRLCRQEAPGELACCLPCPMTDWVYPDYFTTLTAAANWVATAGAICCLFLLVSWTALPVEKTNRHYLSVCLTAAVLVMTLGFVVPLAAEPEQCYDEITPNSMHTSSVCGASGALLLFGGWAGVMWVFLRSLSLHLQICWQVLVGRTFMIFSFAAGWGVPVIGISLAMVFSGVSFRFGQTCHINHDNSLAGFWIPLLVFAGATVIITFATFGYCIKVYLASLTDDSATTEGSNLPTYSITSSKNMSPRQAYRRVRRVISLQWRGIAIVLIIIADVIFFSIVFVFQDTVVQSVTDDPNIANEWALCLIEHRGEKEPCLDKAKALVVNEATVTAVLLLLTLNGIWLLFLLGRWTMVKGWVDLLPLCRRKPNKEFVSVDARHEFGHDKRSYEMLSKETRIEVTSVSPAVISPPVAAGRHTPDYFVQSARYHTPSQSFSSPRPPSAQRWAPEETYASPHKTYHPTEYEDRNPLGMNRL